MKDEAFALAVDEAVLLTEELLDLKRELLGRSVVYSGRCREGFNYWIVMPPAGEAVCIKSSSKLNPAA